MKKQAGFTLVEIAIVMVIIGLLLGGVLKGQEMVTNAKVKNLESDVNGITAAVYSYQDRYRALPGDDKKADRFIDITTCTNLCGDGNRKIALGTAAHAFDSTIDGEESRLFWMHLRNAGLVNGDPGDQTQPTNAFGGLTGVSTTLTNDNVKLPSHFIGFTEIPKKVADIIESHGDDGNSGKGSVQGHKITASSVADGENYNNDDQLYNLYFKL
ncbi:MAG: prepilin-type cleavage/methylation domain-containing protein [Candidatus Parabeggiatoa sp. nov. 2]|nr:MAG: prepilin-type cleavage/methylation domain-containing protein [Gammaproteobacteria bacterium]